MLTLAPGVAKTYDINQLILLLHTLQNPIDWHGHFFAPHARSPLGKAIGPATEVLQKLEQGNHFWNWLQTRSIPSPDQTDGFWQYVLVPLLGTPATFAAPPANRFTVMGHTFAFNEVPVYWRREMLILQQARLTVGDGIRTPGIVRLDLALTFHGINPHAAPLVHLEELKAALSLDLADEPLPFARLLNDHDDALLRAHVENGPGSLLNCLTREFMTPAREIQARATPTVVLEQLLQTPPSLALGARLAKSLGWDEPVTERVRAKLVWRTLWLSLCAPDLARPAHWGYSYRHIRSEMHKTLQHDHNLSPAVASLALRLMHDASPSERWVRDIPLDLRYAVSAAWVNFKSGVLLAEAINPGASRHMKFQQLLDLTATLSVNATPEQLSTICAARLGPTLEWAIAHGVLEQQPGAPTPESIQAATQALAHHEHSLRQAISDMAQLPPGRWRFASDDAFRDGLNTYLRRLKSAYGVLIKDLLGTLPLADRHLIEYGEVTLYALREELHSVQLEHENPINTGAVRGRQGFILKAQTTQCTRYFEVFPRNGLIRPRLAINTLEVNGKVVVENTGGSTRPSRGAFRRATAQPFDWAAYQLGTPPRPGMTSPLIAETLGPALPPGAPAPGPWPRAPQSLTSLRSEHIAQRVCAQLFYLDEQLLLDSARRNVEWQDFAEDFRAQLKQFGKMLVPFWEGVEDLASGDPQRIETGGLSLFTDTLSFALPLGRYLSGSTRLALNLGKISLRATLPDFALLTRQLLASLAKELNPLEAIPDLLALGSRATLKLGSAGLKQFQALAAKLPIPSQSPSRLAMDPRRWRPRQTGDRLYALADLDYVAARQVASAPLPEYRLIDPATDEVFGPRFVEANDGDLRAIPNLADYAVPLRHEQVTQLSPRANGLYDGRNQKSYVPAHGRWYEVQTRISIDGEVHVHIVHPASFTHSSQRIVLIDGVWTPLREGLAGGMRRGRLQQMRDANAARDAARIEKLREMQTAINGIEEASTSARYQVAPGADNILLELLSVYQPHTRLQHLNRADYASLPDRGRGIVTQRLEDLQRFRHHYTALAESFDALAMVDTQQVDAIKTARATIADHTRTLARIAEYDLERLLEALDALPAPRPAALPPAPAPGPSRAPEPPRPTPKTPAPPPKQRIDILTPGDVTVSVKPRANNPEVADALDRHGRRTATYLKTPTGELWVQAVDKVTHTPGPSVPTDLLQRLHSTADLIVADADKLDATARYYSHKHHSYPTGVEDRLRYGAHQLQQGALNLEEASLSLPEQAARHAISIKVAGIRQRAAQLIARARDIRIDLTLRQAPDALALDFLQAQEGLLTLRKTLNRSKGRARKTDFLDEFELKARGQVWAYAHLHFEKIDAARPAKSHLKTPAQRNLGPQAQAQAERQGNRLAIYRADLHWPQVRRVFYPDLPD